MRNMPLIFVSSALISAPCVAQSKITKVETIHAISIRYLDEAYGWIDNHFPDSKVIQTKPVAHKTIGISFDIQLKDGNRKTIIFERVPRPDVDPSSGFFVSDEVCSPQEFQNIYSCATNWLKSLDSHSYPDKVASTWIKPDATTHIAILKEQLMNMRDLSGAMISRRLELIASHQPLGHPSMPKVITIQYISVFENNYTAREFVTAKRLSDLEYEVINYQISKSKSGKQ